MKPEKIILATLEWLKTRGMKLFYASLVVTIAVDFFVEKDDPAFTGHAWPGFYAAYGLVGCFLLVVFSKKLMKFFLYKKESYYD